MENPNEYDDEQYSRYAGEVDSAIGGMWEAGGSLENIEDTVRNALENAGANAEVSITGA